MDADDYLLDEIIAFSLACDDSGPSGWQPLSPFSSSSTPLQLTITCDLCNKTKTLEHCYLDMVGCSHVLCLNCLYSTTTMTCPVPSCRKGSIMADISLPKPLPCKIECGICMESKDPSEGFFDIKGCDHVFCSDCISQYIIAKVEENEITIPCPEPSCSSGSLEPESCRAILPHEVFLRWGSALCESSIDGSVKFYCPYKDCSALMVNEEEGLAECPHCQRTVCGKCKVPWHEGFVCEEYQKLGEGEREREDLMLMKMAENSKWQRCPKCGFYVERVEGCVFIMCRCKHCFCYICGAQMDAKDGRHYCSKCKCTWDGERK